MASVDLPDARLLGKRVLCVAWTLLIDGAPTSRARDGGGARRGRFWKRRASRLWTRPSRRRSASGDHERGGARAAAAEAWRRFRGSRRRHRGEPFDRPDRSERRSGRRERFRQRAARFPSRALRRRVRVARSERPNGEYPRIAIRGSYRGYLVARRLVFTGDALALAPVFGAAMGGENTRCGCVLVSNLRASRLFKGEGDRASCACPPPPRRRPVTPVCVRDDEGDLKCNTTLLRRATKARKKARRMRKLRRMFVRVVRAGRHRLESGRSRALRGPLRSGRACLRPSRRLRRAFPADARAHRVARRDGVTFPALRPGSLVRVTHAHPVWRRRGLWPLARETRTRRTRDGRDGRGRDGRDGETANEDA